MMHEREFEVNGDFIELCKLLKVCGLCESGGASKTAIKSSLVKVDGIIETRRGRKIRRGQTVSFNGKSIKVL